MDWVALRERLIEQFSDGELRDLCFDLNIDYEALAGTTKGDKARELILYCRRQDSVATLLTRCQQLRPRGRWAELDADDEAPRPATESDPPPIPARSSGDVIVATVGAGASNVAVGKHIRQQVGAGQDDDAHAVLHAGLTAVERALQSARADAATTTMATFQLTLLRGELLKGGDEQPSASTLVQVGDWLLQHVPALREPLARLLTTPAAARTLHRAGPQAVTWAQQRFAPPG